jgi:DNA-binding transcriptional LysR family regulator
LTFGTVELARALNDFAAGYPEIELDVSFSDRVVNLVDEGFDVAVRVGRPADTILIARKLCDVRIVLVGSDAYLSEHGEPSAPEDLHRHTCIIDTNFREPGRWPFRSSTGEPIAVPVASRLRYSNAEACVGAAEAGLGLAYVPSFVAGPAIAAGKVRALLTRFEAEAFGVHTLYPHSRHLAGGSSSSSHSRCSAASGSRSATSSTSASARGATTLRSLGRGTSRTSSGGSASVTPARSSAPSCSSSGRSGERASTASPKR